MKKLLIGCAMVALMLTPAAVKADSNDWIGPLIAGTVFGVIISNSGHSHARVRIENRRRHHHRPYRRHRWVEVCDHVPHLRQNHYGDYYTVMRYECRMVKKARW